MIPKVRTWTVRTQDGGQYSVLAPTRLLAVLNLRQDLGVWAPIKSIGRPRRKEGEVK